jgi:hypothetical protein
VRGAWQAPLASAARHLDRFAATESVQLTGRHTFR